MVIINPVPLPPYGGRAYNHITPFTYRDGLTFVEVLEQLRAYIRDVVVPHVDVSFDDLESYIDGAISETQDWTQDAIASLTSYVNNQVDLIINDSIEVQEPVVAGMFSDTGSMPRAITDALYASTGDVTALQGDIATLQGDVSDLDDSVAQIEQNVIPRSVMYPEPHTPAGFRDFIVLPTPKIRRVAGRFSMDEEPYLNLRKTHGGTYYTEPGLGSSGDGLTPETPRQLALLIQEVPDGSTVILGANAFGIAEYFRHETGLSNLINKSISLVPGAGVSRAQLNGFERPSDLTWTVASGNIYQTTRSATVSVLDVHNTVGGEYQRYESRASLAAISGPGQFAIEGTTVYVWPIGNTDLTVDSSQIRLQISVRGGLVTTGSGTVCYAEGIDFYGCGTAASSSYMGGLVALNDSVIVNVDCSVKYNTVDGPATKNGGSMVSIRALVSRNGLDGFNYHNTLTSGGRGEFVEYECVSRDNGVTPGAGTNNASTAHEAICGIRVSGLYYNASGPVVADVNSAHSWNIGCFAGGSAQTVPGSQDQSWRTDGAAQVIGAGVAKMWLDECVSSDAQYALGTTNGSEMYVHAFASSNNVLAYPGSTIGEYVRA